MYAATGQWDVNGDALSLRGLGRTGATDCITADFDALGQFEREFRLRRDAITGLPVELSEQFDESQLAAQPLLKSTPPMLWLGEKYFVDSHREPVLASPPLGPRLLDAVQRGVASSRLLGRDAATKLGRPPDVGTYILASSRQ